MQTRFSWTLVLVVLIALVACSEPKSGPNARPSPETRPETSSEAYNDRQLPPIVKRAPGTKVEGPPKWSHDAIWYQIFVDRFYNGDPNNDPTKLSMQGAYPGFVPDNWHTTPWTQDWYTPDDYFAEADGKKDFTGLAVTKFDAKTALRRYGGDLQGILNKLDYLADLGINAIYFNPINDAPSMHKYDARHWRHVDVNFGPNPYTDRKLIAAENPVDPSTWVLTSADKMFIELIAQAHKRGIRVILDYSWNHTGHTFLAWQDVIKNQQVSEFADWYWVNKFDDPKTPENDFKYTGWFGVYDLPEIRESQYVDHSQSLELVEGDIFSAAAKSHVLAITKRWLDPNGDGDPSDGVNGFRLDVAAEIPLGFWRDYRSFVKDINPEAYLVGEIGRQQFPDDLFDPAPVLKGDVFDAVMNYRWYRAARRFFAKAPKTIKPSEFVAQLKALNQNIDKDYQKAMMNMSASHDSPRLLSSFDNKNKYKFEAKVSQNTRYNSNKPSANAVAKAKLLLAHQFTYIGAPQIWAGDEMGMWGSDDPHNRKPLIWPEFSFEDESSHPLSRKKSLDAVAFDPSLQHYYQSLIALRKTAPVLVNGEIVFTDINDRKRLLAYMRYNPETPSEKAYVVFNTSLQPQQITLPSDLLAYNKWSIWRSNKPVLKNNIPLETLLLEAQSALIILLLE